MIDLDLMEDLTLNPNVVAMKPSATLAMTARAQQMRRDGKPVISLSAGEPDFETPGPIAEAGIRAIRDGFTHYTNNAGIVELREAICAAFERRLGLHYSPDDILCSNGAKQSVALAVFSLCLPSDEVIIPAPYWVSYPEMVRMAGARPVVVSTDADAEYKMTADDLAAVLTPHSRVLIMCSPSNPTGSVYDKAELQAIADVVRQHPRLVVISDEIYEHIIFDATHDSIAAFDGLQDRTIVVNGFSKGYSMTGWRLGYMAGPRHFVKAAAKVQSQLTSAPCSITQKAGVAALALDQSYIDGMVKEFRHRRDLMMRWIGGLDRATCPTPGGAFYLFPDVSGYYGSTSASGRTIESSNDLAMYLLEEYHVALVPGVAFGDDRGVRLSYATSEKDLNKATERLQAGFGALSQD